MIAVSYVTHTQFPIKKILVKGSMDHISDAQIKFIASNKLYGTLFTLDIEQLRHEFKQLSYLRSVDITRYPPDTILIELMEYDTIARWSDGELISSQGVLFKGDSALNIPMFFSAKSQIVTAIEQYHTLLSMLKNKRLSLYKLYIIDDNITKFILSDNTVIITCSMNDLKNTVQLLDMYWGDLHKIQPQIRYINTCYKNAFSIK